MNLNISGGCIRKERKGGEALSGARPQGGAAL